MRTAVSVTIAMTATSAAGSLSARTQSGYGGEGTLRPVDGAGNYESGDDYVVEFLGYRFGFNAEDFEQRVTAAAVKLGLIGGEEGRDDGAGVPVGVVGSGTVPPPPGGGGPLPPFPLA